MPVLVNIAELASCRAEGTQNDVHSVSEAALVWEDEQILWLGPARDLPAPYANWERWDAHGKLVTPGLVDCHTHLVFGGFRADEFARRIAGESYLSIAQKGGGILSTVRATRASSQDELVQKALPVLHELAALGVTTLEAKSGYGLNLDDELKQLRCIAQLAAVQPLEIVPTLLAAHVVPPEYREARADYVRLVCEQLIPLARAQNLARFCDVFVEQSAFTLAEAREILGCAKRHGLGVKLHADQLSAGGGAELAAELGAISADHLERTPREGLEQLAKQGVVAVNLPLAALYTFERGFDARGAMDLGLAVAVATDFNPGSAPSYHLPLALLLACTLSRMTPNEALKGATLMAARALGLEARVGSLEPGKQADFALMDAPSVMHWLYHFRPTRALLTVKKGRVIHDARGEVSA